MTSIRLKYVQAFGGYYYFRRRGYPRVRLPGLPGSPDFMQAYQAALSDVSFTGDIGKGRTIPGSMSALIVAYYGSTAFSDLGAWTRKYRRRMLEKLRAEKGELPASRMEPKHVEAILAKVQKPHMRKQWLKMLRGLMVYAKSIHMRPDDPTAGFKVRIRESEGYKVWSEEEIERYRAHHPLGTMPRLALELLLNTGQRRSDVVAMGRGNLKGDTLLVTQQKTGAKLVIPIRVDLLAVMRASSHLVFLISPAGKPFTESNFTKWFAKQCRAAGIPKGFSAHGLRKAAATRLAEAGCTEKQIAAITGHTTLKEVARYTRAASQALLAREAMNRLRTSECQNLEPSVKTGRKPLRNKDIG